MNEIDRKTSEVTRAAWLYYHEERTQGDIAEELSVSRSTVTRLLQRAKSEGLVQVSLNIDATTFAAERDLERAYGLEKARIVPSPNDDATQKRWLGLVCAELLVPLATKNSILAVAWGTTMQAVADSLSGQIKVPGMRIVALVGGLHNATVGTNTNEVARQLGQYFGVHPHNLLAPVYVQDEAIAVGLANDPAIRDALRLAREASIALFGFGAMDSEATMFKLGHVTAEQKKLLVKKGAVGDIVCRWIDRNGDAVELPSSINPIGISLDDLKKIPNRLAVAGGKLKQEVILAGLRGGFATMLVTDERTAEFLLQNL